MVARRKESRRRARNSDGRHGADQGFIMKRCPECRRDYYDETLLYCLDDGTALLEGPASADEPATAVLSREKKPFGAESATRYLDRDDSAVSQPRLLSRPGKLLVGLAATTLVLFAGFLTYRYLAPDTRQIDSVAVLPFINNTGNTDADYLSD